MTKLEALNEILQGVGVRPVTSYSSPHPDASPARNLLETVSEITQGKGWWFNNETMTLAPEVLTGNITLPANTLAVNPTSVTDNYVRRGERLYNAGDNTFVFTDTVEVYLILELDFDDLPVQAQQSIAATATYKYSIVRQGDQNKLARQMVLMESAETQLMTAEIKNRNYSAFDTTVAQRLLNGMRKQRRR